MCAINFSCSYGYIYGRTSNNNMSDSSVSDTHSGGTARTVSQQTSPSHGTHSSSQSRQDNSTIIFTALFDYVAQGEDELSLQRGETVEVILFPNIPELFYVRTHKCDTIVIFYYRFYLRMQKSQATRDGGLEKFVEKLEFFQPISSQSQKVSIEFRR